MVGAVERHGGESGEELGESGEAQRFPGSQDDETVVCSQLEFCNLFRFVMTRRDQNTPY